VLLPGGVLLGDIAGELDDVPEQPATTTAMSMTSSVLMSRLPLR
jgi:hypothetical protein